MIMEVRSQKCSTLSLGLGNSLDMNCTLLLNLLLRAVVKFGAKNWDSDVKKITVSQFIQYCVYLHVAEVFSVSVLCKGKNFKRSLGPSSVVKLLPVNLSKITGISLRVW